MQDYVYSRLVSCRFGEEKTTCKKCLVHCYQEKYQRQMKRIMRYSGPKRIVKHPLLCIQHRFRGLIRRVEA
nr:nitrous oxide-stimulated promoter family protein [Carnobacterium gallinarum]